MTELFSFIFTSFLHVSHSTCGTRMTQFRSFCNKKAKKLFEMNYHENKNREMKRK